jgi:hypothetical protein
MKHAYMAEYNCEMPADFFYVIPSYFCLPETNSTPMGFEPMRAEPIGFQVQLLNLSDTVSHVFSLRQQRNLKDNFNGTKE